MAGENTPDVRERPAFLGLAFIICFLTVALVTSITRGQIAVAVIAGVIWSFFVLLGVFVLVDWLRHRAASGLEQRDLP